MEIILLSILLILFVVFLLFFFFSFRNRNGNNSDAFVLMQNQLRDVLQGVELKLSESQKNLREQGERFTRDITEMKHLSQQVLSIAEQLQNLEKVLKNQKQRGTLGEAALELVLSNILPPTAYKLQYEFKDGKRSDAVIFAKEGIISIDAKFSLDNYDRLIHEDDDIRRNELEKEFIKDLKKRIDETAQYIRVDEGTLPFAIMFIPAEGIYYDLLINEVGMVKANTRSLLEYAYRDKNVIIVSPTTFAAYLQTILYGFRAFAIEKSAQDIIKRVEDFSRHLRSYEDYFRKMGDQLQTLQNSYVNAEKELKKVDKDILKITKQ